MTEARLLKVHKKMNHEHARNMMSYEDILSDTLSLLSLPMNALALALYSTFTRGGLWFSLGKARIFLDIHTQILYLHPSHSGGQVKRPIRWEWGRCNVSLVCQ